MMTSRISKMTKFVLASAACVAFCTATASAEIHTFWKTDVCPDFGIGKMAKGFELGVMQAPIGNLEVNVGRCVGTICVGGLDAGQPCPPFECQSATVKAANGVGGPFCDLDVATKVTPGFGPKAASVFNANIVHNEGDESADGRIPGASIRCIICQYADEVVPQLPALSLLGTALLMGGILTAGAYQLGRKRKREAVA